MWKWSLSSTTIKTLWYQSYNGQKRLWPGSNPVRMGRKLDAEADEGRLWTRTSSRELNEPCRQSTGCLMETWEVLACHNIYIQYDTDIVSCWKQTQGKNRNIFTCWSAVNTLIKLNSKACMTLKYWFLNSTKVWYSVYFRDELLHRCCYQRCWTDLLKLNNSVISKTSFLHSKVCYRLNLTSLLV